MGIFYDNIQDIIYTASDDNNIRIIDKGKETKSRHLK